MARTCCCAGADLTVAYHECATKRLNWGRTTDKQKSPPHPVNAGEIGTGRPWGRGARGSLGAEQRPTQSRARGRKRGVQPRASTKDAPPSPSGSELAPLGHFVTTITAGRTEVSPTTGISSCARSGQGMAARQSFNSRMDFVGGAGTCTMLVATRCLIASPPPVVSSAAE
jgi:hypothetical protein